MYIHLQAFQLDFFKLKKVITPLSITEPSELWRDSGARVYCYQAIFFLAKN